MSSKKKPESLGIKSFFTSKPAKSAAALDKSEGQKLSAKETECVNLIETEVHGEVHSRPIVKKNAFFMTKHEKQEMMAQERENRIQEEIARSRRETNLLLVKENCSDSSAVDGGQATSSFFLARAAVSAKDSSRSSKSRELDIDSDPSVYLEAPFPIVQNVGIDGPLSSMLTYQDRILEVQLCFTLRRVCAVAEIGSQSASEMTLLGPDLHRDSADWGAQEFSCSFSKSSDGMGGRAVATRAAVGRSDLYPLAQGALNLRALWLQWAHSEVLVGMQLQQQQLKKEQRGNLSQCIEQSGYRSGCTIDLTEVAVAVEEVSPGQKQLTRWLRMWSAKRNSRLSSACVSVASSCAGSSRGGSQRGSGRSKRGTPTHTSNSRASSRGSSRDNSAKKATKPVRKGRRRSSSSDEDDSESDECEFDSAAEEEEEEEEDCWDSDSDGGAGDDSGCSDAELKGSSRRSIGRSSRRDISEAPKVSGEGDGGGGDGDGDSDVLTNVMVLQGPSGSGKSAAVHEAARALGFKVIEVNASQARSGATVKKLIAEAAQSAHIMDNLGGSGGGGGGSGAGLKSGALPLGATDMNLILFDEVDNIFEDEDSQLYSTIQQLAHSTKCPILLTTEQSVPFFKALHARHVTFRRPSGAQEALVSLTRSITSALSRVGSGADVAASTSSGAPKKAFASLFAKPSAQGTANTVSAPATPLSPMSPTLTDAEVQMLQALSSLSGGDLRACLATLQCLPEAFPYKPPNAPSQPSVPSLIDLTDSPTVQGRRKTSDTPTSSSTSFTSSVAGKGAAELVTTARTFAEFMFDKKLDFAVFDSLPRLLMHSEAATVPAAMVGVTDEKAPDTHAHCMPVVHEVHPRTGLCSGGFLVNIRGSHFLQPAAALLGATGARDMMEMVMAPVRVLLDGVVECPCVLKSDKHITAFIPPVPSDGVHVLTVELSVQLRPGNQDPTAATASTTSRTLTLSSTICGTAGGWILLRNRSFPALVSASKGGRSSSLLRGHKTSATALTTTTTSSSRSDLNEAAAAGEVSSGQDTDIDMDIDMDTGNGKPSHSHCSPMITSAAAAVAEPGITATKSKCSSSSNKKRLLGGKLKGGNKALQGDEDEDEDEAALFGTATTSSAPSPVGRSEYNASTDADAATTLPNKRRSSRRVIDDDDASASEQESGGAADTAGAKPTILHLSDVGRLPAHCCGAAEDAGAGAALLSLFPLTRSASDQITESTVLAPSELDYAHHADPRCPQESSPAGAIDAAFLALFSAKLNAVMEECLTSLTASQFSEPFLEPVSEAAVPGYLSVIQRPMDLGTVAQSLKEGLYVLRKPLRNSDSTTAVVHEELPDLEALVADVRQVWSNCVQYNDPGSQYVRDAFLLSFHFEERLIRCLSEAFEQDPQLSSVTVHTADDSTDDCAVHVRVSVNGAVVYLLQPCEVFQSCSKLRKTYSAARIRNIFQDSKSDGCDSEEGAVFASAEEALHSELLLDGGCPAEKLAEVLIRRRTTAASVPAQQQLGAPGLEYEDDEGAPLSLPQLPVLTLLQCSASTAGPSAVTLAGQQHQVDIERELNALQHLSQLGDRLCDSDLISCAAVNLENYLCSEADDAPPDAAFRDYAAGSTFGTLSSPSYAQSSAAAKTLSDCAFALREEALRKVLSAGVRCGVPGALLSPSPSCSSSDGWLQSSSRYLFFQQQRAVRTQLYCQVAAAYVSYPGNRAGNTCAGLLAGETVPALSFLRPALVLDVFPLICAMCRTERQNDADVVALLESEASDDLLCTRPAEVTRSESSTLWDTRRRNLRSVVGSSSSALSQSSRRSSRRSGQAAESRKHKFYLHMKQALNADEKSINSVMSLPFHV